MSANAQQIENLLRRHDLRVTTARSRTLGAFLNIGSALSQPDIEKKVGADIDRVTIYRTLTSFLEKGLIHKVLDDAGASKFALCSHVSAEQHAHSDEHIHFKCRTCGKTSCLDSLPFPNFHPPMGYQFSETSVLIQGFCPKCSGS